MQVDGGRPDNIVPHGEDEIEEEKAEQGEEEADIGAGGAPLEAVEAEAGAFPEAPLLLLLLLLLLALSHPRYQSLQNNVLLQQLSSQASLLCTLCNVHSC